MKLEAKNMKSRYFVIKTHSGESRIAKADEEMTAQQFKGIFIDVAKEVYPITFEEFKSISGED